uniref:Uncharacterized protein n=1 Tax=Rhizophora mucronata TaxID=61149 RepID=A0A2P2PBV3_RHIMU
MDYNVMDFLSVFLFSVKVASLCLRWIWYHSTCS